MGVLASKNGLGFALTQSIKELANFTRTFSVKLVTNCYFITSYGNIPQFVLSKLCFNKHLAANKHGFRILKFLG